MTMPTSVRLQQLNFLLRGTKVKGSNLTLRPALLAVLLMLFLGKVLAQCNICQPEDCSNIHACYNCETLMSVDCLQLKTYADAEACSTQLSLNTLSRATYVQATGACELSKSKCDIHYSESIDVLFYKTCSAGCTNYTITRQNDTTINLIEDYSITNTSLTWCQEQCVPPLQGCSVVYQPVTFDCFVYSSCHGNCSTITEVDSILFTVTCNGIQNEDCPTLLDPADGFVNMSAGLTPGDKASYTCNEGYNLNGSSILTCTSNGTWDDSAPTCVPVDCKPPLSLTYGKVTYSSTVYDARADYECNSGFTLFGSNYSICTSNATWDPTKRECVFAGCTNYTITRQNDTTINLIEDYSVTNTSLTWCQDQCIPQLQGCSVVYQPVTFDCFVYSSCHGNCPTITEADSILFTVTCIGIRNEDCPTLLDPANGFVNISAGLTPGDKASYTCNEGYNLNGSSILTCTYNGTWDDSAPTCVPVDCKPPLNLTDGKVTYSSTVYDARAEYECNSGFTLSGSNYSICTSNATWDPAEPECVSAGCMNYTITRQNDTTINLKGDYSSTNTSLTWCQEQCIPPLQGCSVVYQQVKFDCFVYSSCHGNCETITEADSILFVFTCNGTQNKDCPTLYDPANGFVNISAGLTPGDKASYACNEGYNLNGSSILTCTSNGTWDDSAPTCVPIDCKPPLNLTDGKVSYLSTVYDARADYECNSGFTLSGSNYSICTLNASWDPTERECVSAGETTTASPSYKKLYIMPCICHHNKTFDHLTQEEIIEKLIADTKINTKHTILAKNKYISRPDPRASSKAIGTVAVVFLSFLCGLVVCCDLITIRKRIRRVRK